jgi:hypothetical protein
VFFMFWVSQLSFEFATVLLLLGQLIPWSEK